MKLIDIEVIKNDLLKSISEKYFIPYVELLEQLNCLSKTRIVGSKYSCDHNFFSKDNELSFYWAGFIAADGCAYKKGENKTLNISLSEKDENHLINFKNDINFNGVLHKSITKHSQNNPKWNDSIKCSLQISSSQIFEDLKRFNIEPNKTLIYTFPNWLKTHQLVNHFMRGYVDGDGSFYNDKNRNRICFELRGTNHFLNDFKDVLEFHLLNKSNSNVTTPDSTSKIKYSGKKNVPQIVDFLYKDATVFLERKYKIAKLAKDLINV